MDNPLVGPTAQRTLVPTGGGKTQAYLGLTARYSAMRRLQGTVEGYDGENGVAVLMRYTLATAHAATVPTSHDHDLRMRD